MKTGVLNNLFCKSARRWAGIALAASLFGLLLLPARAQERSPGALDAKAPEPYRAKAVSDSLEIELQVDHVDPAKTPGRFQEGDQVAIRFRVADTASQAPLRSLYPAAWMETLAKGETIDANNCVKKVKAFLSGSLFSQADIDLNVFYVVSLNQDATITVVDPLFGFGGSRLLGMVQLEGRGEDWALTRDQQRLYVSIPDKSKIAVVDTASWKVIGSVEVPGGPQRMLLQPDERYLWAAYGKRGSGDAGVVAVERDSYRVAARIPTGAGAHDLGAAPRGVVLEAQGERESLAFP